MPHGKILFIDKAHPSFKEKLQNMGFECNDQNINYQQLLETASQYVGYIIRSKFAIDKPLLDASTNLKFIARVGAGMENIDIQYAETKGVCCINSPEGNADAVGEFVIGGILALFRHILQADTQVRNGQWLREENRGLELNKKNIGIVGYGNMGKSLAKKLSGFGCRVLAYDKYKTNFSDNFAQEVNLKTLQQEAEIVSIHINYLPENHYYINENWINNFEHNIFLANTSRGKVLNIKDLNSALLSGKVRGAVLDVLEYENIRLQNKPKEEWNEDMITLAKNQNVILSPHIAGQTTESLEKHVNVLINKILTLNF